MAVRRQSTTSDLQPDVQGRIVYREPSPQSVTRVLSTDNAAFVKKGFAEPIARSAPRRIATTGGPPVLHLRSGDTIPCQVTKIDETGVSLTTPLAETTFIPHEKIKAIELASGLGLRLDNPKRDRLLMLPRMQRDSPPLQLIRSSDGDFLRGSIVSMDGETLRIELRLETREIPRPRCADHLAASRRIWRRAGRGSGNVAAPRGLRVQAVRTDGNRLTFVAEKVTDQGLIGVSDVLGNCCADLTQIDQLLLGGAIEAATAELAYHQWKLHTAAEPFAADEFSSAGTEGTDSPLVGKPAPDVDLELLGGGRFRLADCRGQIVILDFWATWCGPCLQSLPQVLEVAEEFRDQGVRLVAVNLEELPDKISASLDRHQLALTVALDRKGAVAERYEATAIPQTVVIDRDGNVARLFVGGGPQLRRRTPRSAAQSDTAEAVAADAYGSSTHAAVRSLRTSSRRPASAG